MRNACQARSVAYAERMNSLGNLTCVPRAERGKTAGVDWLLVRSELAKLRREQQPKMSQATLGEKVGSKATVSRIENVSKYPSHVPKLHTVERWVNACGLKLSDFFRRFEMSQNGAVDAQKEGAGNPPSTERLRDENRALSAALTDLRAFIVRLSDVLTDAAAPPNDRQSVSGARTDTASHR